MRGTKQSVVLVGLGMVAETHLRALADLREDLTLTGILARNPDNARRVADRIESELGLAPQVLTSGEEIAGLAPDFAILATPPSARLPLTELLASAGIPILAEKPLERDFVAARQIVDLCEEAGVALGAVFQHRARAASKAALDRVRDGRVGAVHLVEIVVPWWREQAYYDAPGRGTYTQDGGGVLITQAIHTIDLALRLAGPVRSVLAMTATSAFHRMEAEDVAVAALEFSSGAIGWLTATTASFPGASERIVLGCADATLRLEAGTLQIDWRDGRAEEIGAEAETGGGADPMAFTHAWHRDVIADFAASLKSGGQPMATATEALESHALIDAIQLSAREDRRVQLPEITDA